jgi:hypothetical protein
MPEHLWTCARRILAWIMTGASHAILAIRFGWKAFRYRDDRITIEVLVANSHRRRKIECELRAGLCQLQHVLGPPPLNEIAVVVQQIIPLDRQLAGCYQLNQRPNGSQSALLRVALEVDHAPLSSDALLAVLAEQWIAITNLQSGSSVLVPIDYESSQTSGEKRTPPLRRHPLVPYRDGVYQHRA